MRLLQLPGGGHMVFVHVPKTGGSSVSVALDRLGATQPLPTHATAREIRAALQPAIWDNAIKFAVVRHPYTRLASQWTEMCKPGPLRDPLLAWKPTFAEWVEWLGSARPTPWATDEKYPYSALTNRPMSYYVTDDNGKVIVGHVLWFELLSANWLSLFRLTGTTAPELPVVNVSTNRADVDQRDYLDWYTPRLRDIVYRVYREDFDRWGYKP